MAPSTAWKEQIDPDEAAHLQQLAQVLLALQQRRARKHPVARALHAKQQAAVEASFTVLPGLPEHLRVGLGAMPGTYRALVRFSNGDGTRQSDHKPDVRGIAVKVLGVAGKKLIPGMEDETTQDFLAVLGASTPFRNADEFVWFVATAAEGAATLPLKAIGRLGPVGAFRLIRKLLKSASVKITSVATSRYSSQLPIKWGPYAVRYLFDPLATAEAGASTGTTGDHLGEELAARLAKGPVEYDFKVQFFQDEQRTPIEDGSVEWKEADAPYFTVARLTIPQQPWGKAAEAIEGLSFDPWHALEEHRPLGGMMRARNAAYRLSTQERKATKEPR